jgi:hypothetical protein
MTIKRTPTSSKLYSIASRVLALTMSGWTAALVLWSPSSLASRIAGENDLNHVINACILACCALGLADVLWHDIRGRLIWPSFPARHRHRICVMLYAVLAGLTGMRAFVAVGSSDFNVAMLGAYYLMCAAGIGLIAVALTMEPRHDSK